MRYGYHRPTCSYTLSGGDSTAFETDVRLGNSQPSEQTVISGVSDGTPSTTEYLDILCDWTVPQPLGVIGLLHLSCPVGTKIEVTGRRLGDGGYTRDLLGNSTTQRVAEIPTGRRQAIILCDTEDTDYIGIQVRIWNDANGVTWADDTTDLLVGEIAPYASCYLRDTPKRKTMRSKRSTTERAYNGAAHRFYRGEFRSGEWDIHGSLAEAFKAGLQNGMCWAKLRAMQDDELYRALVVHRGEGDYNTAPDYDLIQQVAQFCLVDWGDIQEEERGIFYANTTLSIEETP